MLTCPLCKMDISTPAPRCPRCQTDLSLLADFVTDLKTLLEKADSHRKAGEIGPAVQGYLEVLEVDPNNAEARAALGPVLLALRSAEWVGRTRRGFANFAFVVVMVATIALAFIMGVGWGMKMMAEWFGGLLHPAT